MEIAIIDNEPKRGKTIRSPYFSLNALSYTVETQLSGKNRRKAQVTATQHTRFGLFKTSKTLEKDHLSKMFLH
jgi:hypothetical protein